MILQMQQELMEPYLPNTKFTKDVLFYDDYLFTLMDEEIVLQNMKKPNEFIELLVLSRIVIAPFLDYQFYDPDIEE